MILLHLCIYGVLHRYARLDSIATFYTKFDSFIRQIPDGWNSTDSYEQHSTPPDNSNITSILLTGEIVYPISGSALFLEWLMQTMTRSYG